MHLCAHRMATHCDRNPGSQRHWLIRQPEQHVRIYDYVEHDHPQLARMWNKRLSGYRSMGYEVVDQPLDSNASFQFGPEYVFSQSEKAHVPKVYI